MNNYTLINEDRILRPVTIEDAEFIVKVRNQKHTLGTIHDTSLDVEKQRDWLRAYLKRENEYYWIITTLDNIPYGTMGLYNYDEDKKQIEIGRWVRIPGFYSNIISSHIQMRDFIFNVLQIERILSDVVATNKQVLKYHTNVLKENFLGKRGVSNDVAGTNVDILCFDETRDSWMANRERLLHLCGDMSKWKIQKRDENGCSIEL